MFINIFAVQTKNVEIHEVKVYFHILESGLI